MYDKYRRYAQTKFCCIHQTKAVSCFKNSNLQYCLLKVKLMLYNVHVCIFFLALSLKKKGPTALQSVHLTELNLNSFMYKTFIKVFYV